MNRLEFKISNDWSGNIGFVGLMSITLSIIMLLVASYYLSILFFCIGYTILSIGKKTILDLDNGTIQKTATILGFVTLKVLEEYKSDEFDTVKVSQYSKTSRFQSRAQSATFKYREYQIHLLSKNNSFLVTSFMDYNKSRKQATEIANYWNYKLDDVIQNKMRANKKEREERLKNRK